MTRQEFVERWKHELAGMFLDALTSGHREAALGLWARAMMQRLDRLLGVMYDGVIPEQPLATLKPASKAGNGPHKPTSQTRG